MAKFKNPIRGENLKNIDTNTDYDTLKLDAEQRKDELTALLTDMYRALRRIEVHLSVLSDLEVNDEYY